MSLHLVHLIYEGNIIWLSYIATEVETCTFDKTEHSEYTNYCYNIRVLVDGDIETKITHYYNW